MERLGWPGRWHSGHLYDDGGLPVHLYPFPVTADGRGPCDASDPEYDHDICWCPFEGCMGGEDAFGFPDGGQHDLSTTVDGLRLRRAFGRADWDAPIPFGPDGWHMTSKDRTRTVIVSASDLRDDDGREFDLVHASIAYSDHVTLPSYQDLCLLHRAVFGNGYAYQLFVPSSSHVNIHETALHLWGRADGKPLMPDFGKIWGSI